ncbi:MAG: nuclear transport factor 2 family protein [Sphaerospermopsis kisseleviana]
MRRVVLLSLFLAFTAGFARATAPGDLTAADAVKTAGKWAALVGASDTTALENLLGDGYTHTHGTGLIETKKEFLAALRDGARDYVRCKMGDLDVQLLGRAAIVAGTLDFKVMARGRKIEGTNRFMMIVERTPAGVRLVAYQATPLKRTE